MSRMVDRRGQKTGLPPGSLVHIGEKASGPVNVKLLAFGPDGVQEKTITDITECAAYRDASSMTWINVDGLHRLDIIEQIGACFKLHPLLLEDIVNTHQRPKLEEYGDHLFIVFKMLDYDEAQEQITWEQVSLVVGPNYVLSFQEPGGDVFDPLRERFRNTKGRLRQMGTDYLAYALIDIVVDNYFLILEKIGEIIEYTEEELVADPGSSTLQAIHELKVEMIFLRKCVWPLREVLARLERGDFPLIKSSTVVYFRDVYDHTIQVIDTIETYRDMISGMLDIYLSSVSNRMNAVMKILTIIATIFMPLTFLAGIYGMNFRHMPELDFPWAYPALWGFIILVAVVMVIWFKRKGWFD